MVTEMLSLLCADSPSAPGLSLISVSPVMNWSGRKCTIVIHTYTLDYNNIEDNKFNITFLMRKSELTLETAVH